jgi:hypothetical protein
MAKSNGQVGAVIASALVPVRFDGVVQSVTKAGVKIETRDLGKQSAVERFFATADIIAHTNEGEGFVLAYQSRPIASFYGDVTAENNVVVTLEGKRDITFFANKNHQLRVDYDANELPSSTEAKLAKRETDKLATFMRRMEEKAGGKSDGAKKKKKKKS